MAKGRKPEFYTSFPEIQKIDECKGSAEEKAALITKRLDEVQLKQWALFELSESVPFYLMLEEEKEHLSMIIKDMVSEAGSFPAQETNAFNIKITQRTTWDIAKLRANLGEVAEEFIKTEEKVDADKIAEAAKTNDALKDAIAECRKPLSVSVTVAEKKGIETSTTVL